jgi:hypothetical protein
LKILENLISPKRYPIAFMLNDAQAYSVGAYRSFKRNEMGRREAYLENVKKELKMLWVHT